jgi:hypothetical protein
MSMSTHREHPVREITIDANDPAVVDVVFDVLVSLITDLGAVKAERVANSVLAELRRYVEELQEDNNNARD